jgi:hypothetical protein
MHFIFLIEDKSGAKAMEILIPKLLRNEDTHDIYQYDGIGDIPSNLRPKSDANKRILLDQLPRILRGYGRKKHIGHIIVICDLDKRDKKQFLTELNNVLDACNPRPYAHFCLAIEEFEAWYLGDLNAVHKAYPHAIESFLNKYKNDSICGTWELLADAVCKGGHTFLKNSGWHAIGKQKFIWAKDISPHMNVNENRSPSFNFLCSELKKVMADDA